MTNLIRKMYTAMMKRERPRYRDRRGHYASGALDCLRDQVWGMQGEPVTNPPDYISINKMMVGDAMEWALREKVLKQLHVLGEHFLADQVTVGGSNPAWNGYEDALMAARTSDENGGEEWEKYVIEIKTTLGIGCGFMIERMAPKDSHGVQLGLYLKDMVDKSVCKRGLLLYYCVSDKYIGTMMAFYGSYDAASGCVVYDKARALIAQQGQDVRFVDMACDFRYDLNKLALDRWRQVDKHLADGTLPDGPEYTYKKPITVEALRQTDESTGRYAVSDSQLIKAIDSNVVIGDWQVKYSRYKDKQLALDGINPEYTPEEIAMMKAEYKRRKPKQRRY